MKKIYDLSKYLAAEKSQIKMGDVLYDINDGFNDLLKIDALMAVKDDNGMTDTEFFQEFFAIALGKEASQALIQLNLPIKAYFEMMECVTSSFNNDDEKEGDQARSQSDGTISMMTGTFSSQA